MRDHTPKDLQLTPEERTALPDKIRNYISVLERELENLKHQTNRDSEELRRKRHSYWNR